MTWPSPLAGYEASQPLPTTTNPDGRSLYNPPAPLSSAYTQFPKPIDSSNNGFDFHVYYMPTNDAEFNFAKQLHERIRREFPELRIYKFWDKAVPIRLQCLKSIHLRHIKPAHSSPGLSSTVALARKFLKGPFYSTLSPRAITRLLTSTAAIRVSLDLIYSRHSSTTPLPSFGAAGNTHIVPRGAVPPLDSSFTRCMISFVGIVHDAASDSYTGHLVLDHYV